MRNEKNMAKVNNDPDQEVKSGQSETEASKSKEEKKMENDHSHKVSDLVVGGIIGAIIVVVLLSIGSLFFFRLPNRAFLGFRERAPVGEIYRGPFGARRGFVFSNSISGKVTAVNGQTFTVDVSGQSKTVQITDSTRFPITSATKMNVGDQVVVWGQQDSNGVIQATRIAVNP